MWPKLTAGLVSIAMTVGAFVRLYLALPLCCFGPRAALGGRVFFDDFSGGAGNWELNTNDAGSNPSQSQSFNAGYWVVNSAFSGGVTRFCLGSGFFTIPATLTQAGASPPITSPDTNYLHMSTLTNAGVTNSHYNPSEDGILCSDNVRKFVKMKAGTTVNTVGASEVRIRFHWLCGGGGPAGDGISGELFVSTDGGSSWVSQQGGFKEQVGQWQYFDSGNVPSLIGFTDVQVAFRFNNVVASDPAYCGSGCATDITGFAIDDFEICVDGCTIPPSTTTTGASTTGASTGASTGVSTGAPTGTSTSSSVSTTTTTSSSGSASSTTTTTSSSGSAGSTTATPGTTSTESSNSPASTTAPPASGSKSSVGGDEGGLIYIILGMVGAILILVCCTAIFAALVIMRQRRKKNSAAVNLPHGSLVEMSVSPALSENYDHLATSVASDQSPRTPHYAPITSNDGTPSPRTLDYAPITSHDGTPLQGSRQDSRFFVDNTGDAWLIGFKELVLTKELGRGAFGVVLMGMWRHTQVAVKQMNYEGGNPPQTVIDEFVGEASLMRNLRPHPHVLLYLGICVDPAFPTCIVTEFMEGGSLDAMLFDETVEISSQQQLDWLTGIAKGMQHLTYEKVAHRDLAARNVLLGPAPDFIAKIADFGLSRLMSGLEAGDKTQSNVGPLKWMAPEAITLRQYSEKSDVWSYGVTAFEILAREKPFLDLTPVQVVPLVGAKALRVYPPAWAGALVAIIDSTLEFECGDRADFNSICKALAEIRINNDDDTFRFIIDGKEG